MVVSDPRPAPPSAPLPSPAPPEAGELRSLAKTIRNTLIVLLVPLSASLFGPSGDAQWGSLHFGLGLSIAAAAVLVVPMFLTGAPVFIVALVVRLVRRASGRRAPLQWKKHLLAATGPAIWVLRGYGGFVCGTALLVGLLGLNSRSSACDLGPCISFFPASMTITNVLVAVPAIGLGLLAITLLLVVPATTSFLAVTETLASGRVERGAGQLSVPGSGGSSSAALSVCARARPPEASEGQSSRRC